MLDRVLLSVVACSAVAVAGVVGGDVVSWRSASAQTEGQVARVPIERPAPVLSADLLRLRPSPTAAVVSTPPPRPPARPSPGRVVTAVRRPVALPPVVPIPAAATPTSAPTAAPTTVSLAQANLYQGMSGAQFAADLAVVASSRPDFITLNEAGHRRDDEIRPAGYASYRATGSPYLAETPVLWRTDRWTAIDQGSRWLTTRKVKWGERAVNWVTLRSTDGQVLTVVSAHPAPTLRRTAGLLPVFVDGLGALVHELEATGPVLVGGDFNVGYHGPLWPAAGLAAAGLTPTYDVLGVPAGGTGDHGGYTIDYVFHTTGLTPTAQATRELGSDHDAVVATFTLG